jgi:hypothetical protein
MPGFPYPSFHALWNNPVLAQPLQMVARAAIELRI